MICSLYVFLLGGMPNLLNNPTFQDGLDGWKHTGLDGVTFEALKEQDRPAARITVPDTDRKSVV